MKRLLALLLLAACGTDVPQTTMALPVSDFLGQNGIVRLRQNHPFRADLAHWVVADGQWSKQNQKRRDADCYYFGDLEIQGEALPAVVALRTCRADGTPEISGVAFHGSQMFNITNHDGLRFEPVDPKVGTCGVVADDVFGEGLPVEVPTTRGFALSTGTPRFVEVVVARDVQLFEAIDQGAYAPDPVMSVHAAAALYDATEFDDRVLPILVGIIDAQGQNPWGNTSVVFGQARTGQYLDNVNAWIADNQAALPTFDELTVLSGYDFTGSTVGLANVEGACDPDYSGVVIEGIGNDPSIAQTLAHELGHTLGMNHDNGSNPNCPTSGYVMTAVYDPDGPFATEFSPCSVFSANQFLATADAACITADSQPAHPEPLCGDGKVEGDEQCDCGPLGCEGRNPCCNDNCTLKAGATCSPDNPCCDPQTCSAFATPTVCRPASGACDVAELCVGLVCAPDRVVPTGESCSEGGWDGACYVGKCVTRGGTCEDIAPLYIFDTPPYQDMCTAPGECGWVECVYRDECVFTEEPTPDGTSCGAGRQCVNDTCVSSAGLPAADGCADPNGCVQPVTPEPDAGNPDVGGAPGTDGGTTGGDAGPNDQPIDTPSTPTNSGSPGGCQAANGASSWTLLVFAMLFLGRKRN
ncbi:MAG: M12 family metallo-peptidase [bacterium]